MSTKPGEVQVGIGSDVDGFVVVSPIESTSCMAVRVDVAEDQAISGLRWYNGTASHAFARILVASGSEPMPPVYGEAVILAENVYGTENDWSEVSFSEPVASLTGTLFVIIQYPANYVPVADELPLGIAYQDLEDKTHYFLSRDGSNWLEVSDSCRILLEPVYTSRTGDTLAKSAGRADDGKDKEVQTFEFSLAAHPNPFNPETSFELSVPRTMHLTVKLFDVRGRLVRRLFDGDLVTGIATIRWDGTDDGGRSVGSGVYFALVEGGDRALTNRVVLIK